MIQVFIGRLAAVFAVLTMLLGMAGIGGSSPLAPRSAEAAPERLVLAFYYAWYGVSDFQSTRMFDLPAQPYNSADRATIERQVDQAKAAGIDAFVLAWEGPGREADENLATLLDVAQQKNFRVATYFETRFFGSPDQAVSALRFLQNERANHPAYLRHEGRPVVFFWDTDAVALGADRSPQAAWATIRRAVDPNRQMTWINEGVETSFLSTFDGHHLYSVAWASDPAFHLQDWGNRVRAAGGNKLWVATAMPGYDDTRTGRSDGFAVNRANGAYYHRTFQGALASNPDWVIITSWNEWAEGSAIEPGRSSGNLYLDITRQYATRFKGMAAPAAPAASPAVSAPASGATWVRGYPQIGESGCVEYVAQWSDGTYSATPWECGPGVIARNGAALASRGYPQLNANGCVEYVTLWNNRTYTWVPFACPAGVTYFKP